MIRAILLLLITSAANAETVFVSPQGLDATGRGSAQQPFASISFALDQVESGDIIEVQAGEYSGRVQLDRHFVNPVTIRSNPTYAAKLRRNGGTVITCFSCSGLVLEGFDIAHAPANSSALVIQIQSNSTRDVTLRNNIIHDSTNNDLLKVNNGARDITIEGNSFYNQAGSDEHIDINSTQDVVVQDNVFFNTTTQTETSSYIVVKDSNGASDGVVGASNTTIRRNVFLNWQGNSSQGFIRVGEDNTSNFEADGVVIENNLMLGNSNALMRSSIAIQGSRNVVVRNNTITGDLPSRNFAIRFLRGNQNMANTQISVSNNIWSDPTGTMGAEGFNGVDVFEAFTGSTASVNLNNNLFHNGGNPIPADAGEEVRATQDTTRIENDPKLPSTSNLVLPTWNGTQFATGETTIRGVFINLIENFGKPSSDSIVIGNADPSQSASNDIRGVARDNAPDIGAYEIGPTNPTPPPAPPPPKQGKTVLSWLLLLLDENSP